ncbi:scabin-related ADP-ribosyltransferase [Streptomyces sp. NPDC002536]
MAVAVALLGGLTEQAAVAQPPARSLAAARSLSALLKTADTQAALPRSELDRISDERDRQLVEVFAEFDEEDEVKEAAKQALESTDPNALREFLDHGEAEARKRAKEKKEAVDAGNRRKVEAMRGTGGPYFESEVERVLKGDARDRADFLAFGADIARGRDKSTEQNDKKRAEENLKRVEMLAASGGPEVKKAAQAALASNDDKVIAEFLEKGYLVAAQKDADARAAQEKAQKEAQEAAEKLRKLAENAARAAEARTKLIAAHGDAVKALKNASNAMSSAAAVSRQADRMLAADRAGKRLSEYDQVKAEVARQVKNAEEAAKQAEVAAGRAKVQADVLVDTGLPHGAQWAEIAEGMASASRAAVKATETAQHAVDATAVDAAGLEAKNQAELHEEQAKQWRANAEQHARAAAELADAAGRQARIAADAADKAKQARIDAQKAEQAAWDHAKKTRDARVEAQRQAKIAAEQRAIAEQERALAAEARARAERERDNAAQARARAEAEARTAAAKRAEAQAAAADAAAARERAAAQEGKAAKADEQARGEETKAREARNKASDAEREHKAQEARARALEAIAAAAKGTEAAQDARRAADEARAEAGTAGEAAGRARSAADEASGAAIRSRSAAIEAEGAASRARAAAAEASAHAARANAAANQAEAAAAAANQAAKQAESEAAATHAAAERANSKAAEATAQEARAGMAAHEAARLAGLAATEAKDALQAANRTKDEADGASRESAMAQIQATVAVQASAAARAAAAGIADPANTAIELTAPFSGSDVDADFAAAVAAAAKKLGADQVTSAEAKAAEAGKAADAAEAAAARANAQVAPAFKAAADAARSSADAARSTAAALKSAAQAAEEAAQARAAAAHANEADAQAQTDANDARNAANEAYADASAASDAANQAESEAVRARAASTEADNQAAAANSLAALAEKEATTAQGAAKQATQDAEAAGKLADSAEEHAKSAEAAAEKADEYAKGADEAAKKAEKYESEQAGKDRTEAAKPKEEPKGEPDKGSDLDEALKDSGLTSEEYKDLKDLAEKSLFDYLKENGAEILIELFAEDIKECIDTGDIPICIWAVVQNAGPAKALKIVGKLPKISKAVWGINKFLDKVAAARKKLKKFEEALEKIRKKIPACLVDSDPPKRPKKPKHGFAAGGQPAAHAYQGFASAAAAEYKKCRPKVVYRSDTRGPDEIFKIGFEPRGSNMDLMEHASGWSKDSGYVATTKYESIAKGRGGNVYQIDGIFGIDVNEAWPENVYADEEEIAIPGRIDPSRIIGVRLRNGTWLPNPNYRPLGL